MKIDNVRRAQRYKIALAYLNIITMSKTRYLQYYFYYLAKYLLNLLNHRLGEMGVRIKGKSCKGVNHDD